MTVLVFKRCIKLLLFIIVLTGTSAVYKGIAGTSARQLPEDPVRVSSAKQVATDHKLICNEEMYL